MKITRGIYEQVISKALNEEIKRNIDNLEVYKETINYTDASSILSTYLSYVFKKGLNYYKSSKEDVVKQIEIVNKIISVFSNLIDDEEFKNYRIDENNILKGIFDKEIGKKDINKLYPITSIAKSSLFKGNSFKEKSGIAISL